MKKSVKKITFKRRHKGRIYGININQKRTKQTTHVLVAKECGFITQTQIKTLKNRVKKDIKKKKYTWLRIAPFFARSKKPKEVRMGKGKGAKLRDRVAPVQKGQTIIELKHINKIYGNELLRQIQFRLPIGTKTKYTWRGSKKLRRKLTSRAKEIVNERKETRIKLGRQSFYPMEKSDGF